MGFRSIIKENKIIMKMIWNNFKACFAMYSRIPMPRADWEQENVKYLFCFFPLVGLAVGAASWLVWQVGCFFEFQDSFLAVLLVLIPAAVTGGIHLDGLLDTADALNSWQGRERRLEILKDSNAGAFAVITAGVYFLACYGAAVQLVSLSRGEIMAVLCLAFGLSRCLSGISVMSFPKARRDGTVAEFSKKAEEVRTRNILIAETVILGTGMLVLSPAFGSGTILAALLTFWYYRHMALKNFGGITGDLAGFFLCTCEAVMALTAAVLTAIVF